MIQTPEQFREEFILELQERDLTRTMKNNQKVIKDIWENPDKTERTRRLMNYMSKHGDQL